MEKEKRKLELLAADVAIQKAQAELTSLEEALHHSNSSLPSKIRGTYDYGFTSKSSGIRIAGSNSNADSVPKSAIALAADNFLREFRDLTESVKKRLDGVEEPPKVYDFIIQ